MAFRTKPDMSAVWASLGDNTKPLDSYITNGWEAVKPPRQYFNWLDNRQDSAIAYLYQAGIVQWDDLTDYEGGAGVNSYVQGSDGKVYVALADSGPNISGTGTKDPTNPANSAFWEEAFAVKSDIDAIEARVDTLETQIADGSGVTNPAAWRTAIGFLQAMYPVGSLYFNATSTANPNTILGFGTWTKISGRVLVGHDAGQTEFNTLLATGGAKTHTLTANEMPTHRHLNIVDTSANGGLTSGNSVNRISGAGLGNMDYSLQGSNNDPNIGRTSTAGGSQPHNNLQPYIVVSIWYRTA